MPQKSSDSQPFTYETRLHLTELGEEILFSCKELMSTIERKLFADVARGKKAHELKAEYLKGYGITARHFNAIRTVLEGKISSIVELRKDRREDLKGRISSLTSSIKKLQKKKTAALVVHQKKRRLAKHQSQLASLEQDHASGKVRLCFGSRKLFRSQFDLSANGYATHEEWKKEWEAKRSNSFFLLGSKDETAGNQSCVATIASDGSLTLRIRLPDALSQYGKYLVINNVQFAYGHEAIVAGLKTCLERAEGNKNAGVAICYRFHLDEKGWRVFVSLPVPPPEKVSLENIGVIGIDINADHLALVETDRYLNPIRHEKLPLSTYGKDTNQAKALIGNTVRRAVEWSTQTRKPLVIEKLSFGKKKQELRELGNTKYARMLSSFAYSSIITMLKSRAFRNGISVKEVNSAYTSIIGRVKFSKRYGLSNHESAALCIGRRSLGGSERLPCRVNTIHDGKGGHVAFSLPARNREKHVWSSWGQIRKEFLAAHAAHSLAANKRSKSRL
jgi:IS605 OrfB family transposase